MFDAVIFDCDGVLVDTEVLALEVEWTLLGELGFSVDRAAYARRYCGLSEAEWCAAIAQEYPGLRERFGEFQASLQQRLHAAYHGHGLRAIAGVERAIAAAPGRRAVSSSSSSTLLAVKLQRTGLWPMFAPHVYGADAVARGKPAPDLFLHAARSLGVDPARCLAIEDSANGVRAGLAAGMQVWGFLGGGHMNEQLAAGLRALGAARLLGSWDEAARAFEQIA
ncbi:MAG TPA: HAD-IA family hydrolase [Myxococcota bacterium]|nr:HAD-IA family hydrolase [Myxococcota bacterium]